MEQEYKYMVCTRCMTYNHAPYIVDAMNGFTMQETTFPVITCIVDDASTDGEQEVIRQYLSEHFQLPYRTEETEDYYLICANHNTNPNCTFVVLFLKYNHYRKKSKLPYISEWHDNAKYIALCEGDDYWIHPKKLQIQVEFLESHPNHTLCIHAFRHDIIEGRNIVNTEIVRKYNTSIEIIPDEAVLNRTGRFSATSTMFYRKTGTDNYPEWALRAPVGDRPLKMVLFLRGHIGYIDAVMSVYQEGTISSWTLRMKNDPSFRMNNIKGRLYLARAFDKYTKKKYHHILAKEIRALRISVIKEYIKKWYLLFNQ